MSARRLLLLVVAGLVVLLAVPGSWHQAGVTRAAPAAAAHYCGPLTSSATWTAAGGPYQLDCTVTVPVGLTLTIQGGTTVQVVGGAALQVAGNLQANGTSAAAITFTCVASFCGPGTWTGIQFLAGAATGSSITYASITGATSAIYDFPGSSLSNDTFSNDVQDVIYDVPHTSLSLSRDTFGSFTRAFVGKTGTVTLTSDSFTAPSSSAFAVSQAAGTLHVQSTTFSGTQTAITLGTGVSASVTSSQFTGDPSTSTAISMGQGASLVMTLSSMLREAVGVSATQAPASIAIARSSIINGGTGMILDVENGNLQINQSNIYGNTVNIRVSAGRQQFFVDATNDWWNTTNANAIAATIIDCRTTTSLPCVRYTPLLTSAPVTPPGATPTPTLTPTATATATPTSTPTVSQLRLSPASVTAGSGVQVTATGSGFGPSEPLTVSVTVSVSGGGSVLQQATTTTFDNGTFIVQLPAVPANAVTGSYVVTATGAVSRRTATAGLTVSAALATATPTPTATSTPTPTPTLTPTPTATATPTQPAKQTFKIKRAFLWYHSVRLGTSNHVVIQANHHKRYDVSLHVIFPAQGHDLHITGQTDKNGHWEKTFAVGKHTDARSSHQVLVLVQLRQGLSTKLATLSFTLVH